MQIHLNKNINVIASIESEGELRHRIKPISFIFKGWESYQVEEVTHSHEKIEGDALILQFVVLTTKGVFYEIQFNCVTCQWLAILRLDDNLCIEN